MTEQEQVDFLKNSKEVIGPSLNSIVGKRYWDFVYQCPIRGEDAKQVELIIHFPLIEITNSEKRKHIIQDLYVAIPMAWKGDAGYINGGIEGIRATLTPEEAFSGYSHSHLPSYQRKQPDWAEFCLGSGKGPMYSAINSLVMLEDWDLLKFEVLLMQLDKYVRWESLEGGPYRQIKEIAFPAEPTNFNRISTIDTSRLLKLYKKKEIELPFNYKILGNSMLTIELDENDPEFITLLDKYTSYKGTLNTDKTVFSRIPDPFYQLKEYLKLEHKWRNGTYRLFDFNGRKVTSKIQRPILRLELEKQERTLVAHPEVRTNVAYQINYYLKHYCNGKQKEITKGEEEDIWPQDTYQSGDSYRYFG